MKSYYKKFSLQFIKLTLFIRVALVRSNLSLNNKFNWPIQIQIALLQHISRSKHDLEMYCLPNLTDHQCRIAAENLLSTYGVVIITEELKNDMSIIDNLYSEISQLLEDLSSHLESKSNYQNDLISIEHTWSSYTDLTSRQKSVLNVRGQNSKWDVGMMDLFNPKYSLNNSYGALEQRIIALNIPHLLSHILPGKWELENANIYINNSVGNTRGFHVDDYTHKSFKLFVYLTNVDSLNDGPYCYVAGSHAPDRSLENFNYLLNELFDCIATDSNIVDFEKVIPILGKKGVIIISNQSGSHRGHPQAIGASRLVAVFHFSKTN